LLSRNGLLKTRKLCTGVVRRLWMTIVYLFSYGQLCYAQHSVMIDLPHFWGGSPKNWACDPEIRTWLRFMYNAPTHQV